MEYNPSRLEFLFDDSIRPDLRPLINVIRANVDNGTFGTRGGIDLMWDKITRVFPEGQGFIDDPLFYNLMELIVAELTIDGTSDILDTASIAVSTSETDSTITWGTLDPPERPGN